MAVPDWRKSRQVDHWCVYLERLIVQWSYVVGTVLKQLQISHSKEGSHKQRVCAQAAARTFVAAKQKVDRNQKTAQLAVFCRSCC